MKAVVYAFGVEDGVASVAGAAPLLVLARQVPRLIVQAWNGDNDRGARFFPLMGRDGQQRRFFAVAELLPDAAARRLHGQDGDVAVVLGLLRQDTLRLRVLGPGGDVRMDAAIPFDQHQPLAAVARAVFEISGALGERAASWRPVDIDGGSLAEYLQAADALLALEANLLGISPAAALDHALCVLGAKPDSTAARQLVLQLAGRATSAQLDAPTMAAGAARAAALVGDDALPFLEQCAALVEAAGGDALALHERLLRIAPSRAVSATRVASARLAGGDPSAARAVLESAVGAGSDDPLLLSQLAALQLRCGAPAERARTMERLVAGPIARADRPAVLRVAAGWLGDGERWDEAAALLERALVQHARDAGLWFEQARVRLARGDGAGARDALSACLRAEPPAGLRADAERLLRFCEHPHALAAIVALDRALAAGAVAEALRLAKDLAAAAPRLGEAWLCLGAVRQRLGHHWRARRAYRRALAREETLGEAHNRLGILLVLRRRPAVALTHLLRAAELMPGEPSVRVHLAQAYAALARLEEARAAVTEAERLGQDPQTLARLRSAFLGAPA